MWRSHQLHSLLSFVSVGCCMTSSAPERVAERRRHLRRYRLHIVGEVTVAVRHCLLALPGVARADVRRVVSHYQALAQCDGYIRRLPGVVREPFHDTAGAAKAIADGGYRRAPCPALPRLHCWCLLFLAGCPG